jgi:hypothetical protein
MEQEKANLEALISDLQVEEEDKEAFDAYVLKLITLLDMVIEDERSMAVMACGFCSILSALTLVGTSEIKAFAMDVLVNDFEIKEDEGLTNEALAFGKTLVNITEGID